jgi:uncharacterized protein YjgD (DUF1641 family)
MTNEELILQRLDSIEEKIDPILKSRAAFDELKADIVPLSNTAVALLMEGLQEVESGFTLEDLTYLAKLTARNVQNFIWALKMMDNVIEFINDIEPLLKSAVPQIIEHLDTLEQRGVFRIIKAMMDVRAKVADAYSPEDVDTIGDGAVAMLALFKKFSDPKALALMEKLAALPAEIDLTNAKKAGPMRLAAAPFNGEFKEGMGVMLEFAKAMAKLKPNGQSAETRA